MSSKPETHVGGMHIAPAVPLPRGVEVNAASQHTRPPPIITGLLRTWEGEKGRSCIGLTLTFVPLLPPAEVVVVMAT